MKLSHKKFLVVLIHKIIKKEILCQNAEISTNAMSKMKRNKQVSLAIILKICEMLNCKIEDVATIVSSEL